MQNQIRVMNMQTENRFFDDLARMASGAFGTMASLRTEFEGQVRQQLDALLARMKLVTREEYEATQAMLAKAREEQEALAVRVAALESLAGRVAALEEKDLSDSPP